MDRRNHTRSNTFGILEKIDDETEPRVAFVTLTTDFGDCTTDDLLDLAQQTIVKRWKAEHARSVSIEREPVINARDYLVVGTRGKAKVDIFKELGKAASARTGTRDTRTRK